MFCNDGLWNKQKFWEHIKAEHFFKKTIMIMLIQKFSLKEISSVIFVLSKLTLFNQNT